jgi:hypothetical protein
MQTVCNCSSIHVGLWSGLLVLYVPLKGSGKLYVLLKPLLLLCWPPAAAQRRMVVAMCHMSASVGLMGVTGRLL